MKKKLLVVSILALSGSGVMAQSAFDGAYGQLGIGYSIANPSTSSLTQSNGSSTVRGNVSDGTAKDFTGTVTVGYMGAVSNGFLLGIGAEYSPLAGSSTTSTVTGGGLTDTNFTYKIQNSYNIFLSPAFIVDKDKLVYGKVGYAGAQVKFDYGTANSTANFTGYSFGLGYKQVIKAGFYGFVEGNYFSYGSKTINFSDGASFIASQNTSINSYNFLAGVGYKF